MGLSSAAPLAPSGGHVTSRPAAQAGAVAGGVASVLADAATRQEQDPSAALHDLQLIPVLRDLLKPTLDRLGFTFAEGTAKSKYGFRSHLYTTLVGGDEVRRTLHIPNWILDNPTEANYNALSALAYAFKKETLFIFSNGLAAPHFRINQLLFGEWLEYMEVTVSFVPWRHIEDLGSMNEEEQGSAITGLLKLDAISQPKGRKVLKLEPKQKDQLIEALTGAFQTEGDLLRLGIKLGEHLTTSDNLTERIINLVTWADGHDRFEDLINKACEVISTNKVLNDLKKGLLG